MRRRSFPTSDNTRKVDAGSGKSVGWLQSLKERYAALRGQIDGLGARMDVLDGVLGKAQPGFVAGRMVFQPESAIFPFDYLQDGSSSVQAQYVVRDGVTYSIPIQIPPPGCFEARYLYVGIYQRLFNPDLGPMQLGMLPGNWQYAGTFDGQSKKYAYPDPTSEFTLYFRRQINFVWNLVDGKSGVQLSDDFLPDYLLLPQLPGSSVPNVFRFLSGGDNDDAEVTPIAPSGRYLELSSWLFERDAQVNFLFRPITPVIQPASSVASPWYYVEATTSPASTVPWDDRENGVRNSAVTVQVELHGTRYYNDQDALRLGARVP